VGEGRQAAEGRGELREALHGERVVLHDLRGDGRRPRQQERGTSGPAVREGRPARSGRRRVLEGGIPPRGRGGSCASASRPRPPSSSCAPRTTRRRRSRSRRPATRCGRRPCVASRRSRPTVRPTLRPGS
jgi:hypothetical protein